MRSLHCGVVHRDRGQASLFGYRPAAVGQTVARSYFYIENINLEQNFINLPAYLAGPPAEPRANWSHQPKTLSVNSASALAPLQVMIDSERLKPSDLLAAFVERRVLPLQGRPHIISAMSGCRDPSRMSTKEMPRVGLARHVNDFSNCKLSEEEWCIGKEPFSRANPPPVVSTSSGCFIYNALCSSVLTSRLLQQRFPGQGASTADHEWMTDR